MNITFINVAMLKYKKFKIYISKKYRDYRVKKYYLRQEKYEKLNLVRHKRIEKQLVKKINSGKL